MHIFCSKALADALNIKKNELQKMPVDAQIDELYAWHGHITKLNGKNTIILMNDRTMYSLIFRNRLPRNVDKFAELVKEAIPYTMEVGGFNNLEIDKYMSGVGEIIFAEKADRQMTGNLTRMFLDMGKLKDKMLLLGHKDYLEVCSEIAKMIEEGTKARKRR